MRNVVVGAGISGAVVANILAAEYGEEVEVIEQRPHVAGNCYDYQEDGITVHRYGSHIFHTNNQKVWQYLRRFTDFNQYMHRVLAVIDGHKTTIPFSLTSLHEVLPGSLAADLEERLLARYEYGSRIALTDFLKQDDPKLKFLSGFVYEKVFAGYTRKQWGLEYGELGAEVCSRVPVCISTDQRYFNDVYQGIPLKGYTALIEAMLDQSRIRLKLNTPCQGELLANYLQEVRQGRLRLFYTGSLDELWSCNAGVLPYRSLRFEFLKLKRPYYQENAVMNYPCNYDFTRIHEFKYYLDERSADTIIAKEYAVPFVRGENERYYPIATPKNQKLYAQYQKQLQEQYPEGLKVLGRLGDYRYYNMDTAVERALEVARL